MSIARLVLAEPRTTFATLCVTHSVRIYSAACGEAHNKQLQHVIHTAGIIQGLRLVMQHPFEYVIMTTSNIVHLSIISISTTSAHYGVLPALC